MSLLKSLSTIIWAGFFLLACSAASVVDKDVYDEVSKIRISIDKGRPEQLYRQELQRLISRNGLLPQQYELRSVISSSTGDNNMIMGVQIELYDQTSGEVILTHSFSSSASIGGVPSIFGSSQAENHARERLSLNLAQKTFGQLILFFTKRQSTQ